MNYSMLKKITKYYFPMFSLIMVLCHDVVIAVYVMISFIKESIFINMDLYWLLMLLIFISL